jgi:hypothetical protein
LVSVTVSHRGPFIRFPWGLALNVTAFLVFIALVILAQAPDGAAAFKGPDAVATNLVNTACASCHSLDRVNDKKADKDGWTTTVTRMKGLGANLTYEQVPVVAEFPLRFVETFRNNNGFDVSSATSIRKF